MPDASLCILSTRALEQSLVEKAAVQGISIDTIPFIQTRLLPEEDIKSDIKEWLEQPAIAVFTSVQAVISVSRFFTERKPAWIIYCLSEATHEAVNKYLSTMPVAGTAADSTALAALIIADRPRQEVVFFCGDKRKNTIYETLSARLISVTEQVVYSTTATPSIIDKKYNGIAFFSPSAVESFFSVNTLQTGTVCFAIGNTTAAAVKPFLSDSEKLFISPAHNAAALVQLITDTLHA